MNATAELGRFAPASWGLAMPLTVSYARRALDPLFLQGTDVRADRLDGLREAGSARRRLGLALRKTTPSSNPLVSALVDGTSLRLGYVTARDATVTTASRVSGIDAGIDVDRRVGTVDLDVIPGFVETLLRWLAPRRVEESAFFDRLAGTRLRLTPERVGMSLAYASQDERVWRYERPLATPGDDDVAGAGGQRGVRRLGGAGPVVPPGGDHVVDRRAVAGQEGQVDGEPGGGESLGEGAHRLGCAGEPVHHEHADVVAIRRPGLQAGDDLLTVAGRRHDKLLD